MSYRVCIQGDQTPVSNTLQYTESLNDAALWRKHDDDFVDYNITNTNTNNKVPGHCRSASKLLF